jgi:HPt (histidine-containing phosphotransfer) domain-containing protein
VNLTSCGSLDEFGRLPSHRNFDVVILNYFQGELTGAQVASVLGEKPILLISQSLPPDIESWHGDIRNFLPKASGPETLLATALFLVSSPEMEGPPPDPALADQARRNQILDTIQRLIKEDDPEFIREVVDLFLAQSAGLILNIHVALGKKNSGDVLRLVQELRANSANVGAQSLARWCALLEDRSRDEKWERCLLLAKGLSAEFRRLKELLERPT